MQNMLVLNVGLDASKNIKGSKDLMMHNVFDAVSAKLCGPNSGNKLASCHLAQSSSEITAVVVIDFAQSLEHAKYWVADLAADLKQDAIAAIYNSEGFLVGPHASQWGEFSKEYFVL